MDSVIDLLISIKSLLQSISVPGVPSLSLFDVVFGCFVIDLLYVAFRFRRNNDNDNSP